MTDELTKEALDELEVKDLPRVLPKLIAIARAHLEARESGEGLPETLRDTTEEMANRCSVDQFLWQRHSRAALDAADALAAKDREIEDMREALNDNLDWIDKTAAYHLEGDGHLVAADLLRGIVKRHREALGKDTP